MANILDLLGGTLNSTVVSQLDKEVGIGDPSKTANAVETLSQVILAGVNRNAQSLPGLESLNQAFETAHTGDMFNDVPGNLLNPEAERSRGLDRTLNGAGILRHVFGAKESGVLDALSQSTKIDKSK